MPKYLIDGPCGQVIEEHPSEKCIYGKVLWDDVKHGAIPDNIVIGAMELVVEKEAAKDELGKDIEVERSRKLIINP